MTKCYFRLIYFNILVRIIGSKKYVTDPISLAKVVGIEIPNIFLNKLLSLWKSSKCTLSFGKNNNNTNITIY